MDEPFGSTSILAQWTVFQLASEHGIKVMLDGQGADEQLAGYLPFFAWRYQELLRAGRIPELIREVRATNANHGSSTRRLAMVSAYLTLPAWLGRLGGRVIDAPGQNPGAWLDLDALGVQGHPDPMKEFGATKPSVQALAASQLTATNLPALLRYEDRDSMAHSVEARVPFLDHRLVEFVLGLPSEYLISQGTTKRVLREAMRTNLPEPIRTRVDKIGFQTAEESWMRKNPDLALGMTRQAVDRSGGVLRASCVSQVEQMLKGGRAFDYSYWRRISYGAWLSAFDGAITA
jgi:asparagine synthase (glutamine-hydrolysing)